MLALQFATAEYWTSQSTHYLLAVLSFAYLLKVLVDKTVKSSKQKLPGNIPGLEAIPLLKPTYPIIGNVLPHILTVPRRELFQFVEKVLYSVDFEAVRVVGLGQTGVVFNSPALVETLLKSGDLGHIRKPTIGYGWLKPIVFNCVAQQNKSEWKDQRKLLLRSQKFSVLKEFVGVVCSNCIQCVKALEMEFKDGGVHTISHPISFALLACILETVTGFDCYANKEFEDYHVNLGRLNEGFCTRATNPLATLFWKIHPASKKFDKAANVLNEFAKKQIQKRKLENNSNLATTKRCVIDDMLEENYTERQMIDEINVMIIAGHETSAFTTQYLCFLLSLNPTAQQKCREEIDAAFSENQEMWENGNVPLSVIKEGLKYLERCIMETLRLFPPVYNLLRQLGTPLDIEIDKRKVQLPTDTVVFVSPFLLHRNPKYYPEPKKFDPDRFLPENVKNRHPYAHIPFSAGPRSCLGINSAIMEIKALCAYLLRNFEFQTLDKFEDVAWIPGILMQPERPYRFLLTKRIHQA